MLSKSFLVVSILYFGFLGLTYSQVNRPDISGRTYGTYDSSAINRSVDTFSKKDLQVFKLSLLDLSFRQPYYDSLNKQVQLVEPVYLQNILPGNLGSINSAAYQNPYEYDKLLGPRIGHEQYDLLLSSVGTTDFMDVNRSLWAIHYQKGYMINSSNVAVDFYRRFNNNLLLNFNYDRYSDRSWLNNQSNKLGNLDLKFFQDAPNGKRKSYVVYSSKSVEENHSRTLIAGENGLSLYSKKWFELGNEFLLKTSETGRSQFLSTKISINSNKYQFDDSSLSTTEYDAYGVEESFSKVNFSNGLSSLSLSNTYSLRSALDDLSFSANISSHDITNTVDTISQFQLSTNISYNRQLSDSLSLDIDATYSNWEGDSEYSLFADLKHIGVNMVSDFGLGLARQLPSLFQSKAYSNDFLLWDNAFKPQTLFDGSIDLTYLPLGLSLQSKASFANNAIVSDNTGKPIQLSESFISASVILSRDIDWWILRSNHNIMWQHIGTEFIPRPTFQLNGNVATDFTIFKAELQSTLGLDYYYIFNFSVPSFNPVYGSFYNDGSGSKSGHILIVNPYASFRIDNFSFYFKMENALSRLVGQNYFLTRDYNIYDLRISFGVKWRLLD